MKLIWGNEEDNFAFKQNQHKCITCEVIRRKVDSNHIPLAYATRARNMPFEFDLSTNTPSDMENKTTRNEKIKIKKGKK